MKIKRGSQVLFNTTSRGETIGIFVEWVSDNSSDVSDLYVSFNGKVIYVARDNVLEVDSVPVHWTRVTAKQIDNLSNI